MSDLKRCIHKEATKEFAMYLAENHTDLFYRWEDSLHTMTPEKVVYFLRSDSMRGVYVASAFRRIIYNVTKKVERSALEQIDVTECIEL